MLDIVKNKSVRYFFPHDAVEDPQIGYLADLIDQFRDEIVWEGDAISDSNAIEQLDLIFKCYRAPSKTLPYLNEFFDADFLGTDTERKQREKICRAVYWHRYHGTAQLIKWRIEEVTGITPDILVSSDYSSGWDEDNSIDSPPYLIDFHDGIYWDEDDSFTSILQPEPFIWAIYAYGILVDIKNDGAYTVEQLERIYQIIAEEKPADLAAEVGYIDSVTAERVVLKTIYSLDLTQTAWPDLVDPGI